MAVTTSFQRATIRTVVIALIIDILAFTIILPLFPRLIAHYESVDGENKDSLFYAALQGVKLFRQWIGGTGSRLDIILFGGFIGSLFSFLQFISSPVIGQLSDRYGRRTVLLLSMLGNGLSMLLWIFSGSFGVFIWSRIVGGLTEGNVQMSIAIISDITSANERSKNLAWVGISFALGFTVGPPLGAYFASVNLKQFFPSLPINQYSSPALFAFMLIVIETVYLYLYLPETSMLDAMSPMTPKAPGDEEEDTDALLVGTDKANMDARLQQHGTKDNPHSIARQMAILSAVHFIYLFVFSGMEFTLTFLTYDRFQFSHLEQGKLLAFMGISSAVVQGGYVRRVTHKYVTEKAIVVQGIASCAIGLAIVGLLATDTTRLYIGAAFLAFTSGTVVNTLTSLASLTHQRGKKSATMGIPQQRLGLALGKFRSLGQLGRSIGPIVACSCYWILGNKAVYAIASVSMAFICIGVSVFVESIPLKKSKKA